MSDNEAESGIESLSTADVSLSYFSPGRPLFAELSPVTDFREACCRQNDLGNCDRGGFCNFMHLRHPSRHLLRELQRQQREERKTNPEIVAADEERRKQEAELFGGAGGGGGDYGREMSPPRGYGGGGGGGGGGGRRW